jgi:dCTP deaminase
MRINEPERRAMPKNDRWIKEMASKGMIEPFNEEQVRKGVISYGISSYGYDLRLHDEFKLLQQEKERVLDPKNFNDESFEDFKEAVCEAPANSFVICRSLEYFRIPRDVLVVCFGKPEWEGFITMSVSNTSPCPVRVYANEGIAQIVFLEVSELCETSYADKKGKYQAQKGIVLPKI